MGHLTVKTGNIAGNLTKIFRKSQMPQGLPGGGGDGQFWNWPVHEPSPIRLGIVPVISLCFNLLFLLVSLTASIDL